MLVVVLLARLALAAVFVVSALAKLRDRTGSRQAVQDFGVPPALAGAVAAALPLAELACAGLLLTADPGATVGAVGSLALLGAFTAAIVVNLVRGRRPECHCFGELGGGRIGWTTVGRNAVLLVLAGLSLVGAGSQGSVPAVLADYSAAEVAVGASLVALVAAVVVLAVALRTLLGRYGQVLLRLEALESATGLTPLPLAPSFELPDLAGEVVGLQGVLDRGRPVLVAFVSPGCSMCGELVPDLAEWQRDDAEALSVLVLSTGSVEDNQHKFADADGLRVLLHEDVELRQAFGVQGTPAAVLLGVDGRIARVAHGVGPVRDLHREVLARVSGPHDEHDHGHSHGHGALHEIGPRPVTAGDPLPEVPVTTETGQTVVLPELVADEAVLLFWRTSCGFCAQIVDDVAALESTVPIVFVVPGEVDALRAGGLVSPLAREDGHAVSAALQVAGTPSAVRVRGGVVDSPVAVGGPDVLALLHSTARAEPLMSRSNG